MHETQIWCTKLREIDEEPDDDEELLQLEDVENAEDDEEEVESRWIDDMKVEKPLCWEVVGWLNLWLICRQWRYGTSSLRRL